jgi:hypothetical protein
MTDNYMEMFAKLYQKSHLPSKDLSIFWHQAVSPKLKTFKSNDKTGKWCIFLSPKEVDSAWEKIKSYIEATENLDTLFLAKVSTKLGSQTHANQHVICVYTSDWENEENLKKTRQVLTNLGFTQPLNYKRDTQTLERKYNTEDEFYLTM